jgi:hypothetical protein
MCGYLLVFSVQVLYLYESLIRLSEQWEQKELKPTMDGRAGEFACWLAG